MPSAVDNIPIASIETTSYSAPERREAEEIEKLMAASRRAGFFYLDFEHSGAAGLPKKKNEVLKAMKDYFNQPDDVKQLDSKGIPTRGYVRKGTFTAVDPNRPDESFEHLAIGTHDLGTNLASTLPALFKKAGALIPDYVALCERVVDVLLDCYSQALGVPGQFLEYHDHEKSSDTILAMLSYPGKDPNEGQHQISAVSATWFVGATGLEVKIGSNSVTLAELQPREITQALYACSSADVWTNVILRDPFPSINDSVITQSLANRGYRLCELQDRKQY